MPLDVQPLSPLRRAVMLLVMLAVLGASLAFAQVLVKHQKPPFLITTKFALPEGVKDLPVIDSADQAFKSPVKKATAIWGDHERAFVAFSFDVDPKSPPQLVLDKLCLAMTGVMPPPNAPLDRSTFLAGRQALERCLITEGDKPHFEVLRMTIQDDHVVAFGFSGTGTITDKDRMFFHNYCLAGVQITRTSNR